MSYPLTSTRSRRGADYSIDQLSRFLDRGVRDTMQRVVVEEPGERAGARCRSGQPAIDLRAIMRGRFAEVTPRAAHREVTRRLSAAPSRGQRPQGIEWLLPRPPWPRR